MLSRKVIFAVLASAVMLTATSIFMYQGVGAATSRSSSTNALSENATRALGAGAAASATSTEQPAMLEVHIANNGLVLLRGARVVSISSNNIRVATTWESTAVQWTLKTNSNTKFYNSKGETQTIGDIKMGSIVSASGHLSGSGDALAIEARSVREQ